MGAKKREDFSKDSTVDITVWKTLWRMWKALDYEQFMKVAARLWVILRNNISGKNRPLRRERAGKEERRLRREARSQRRRGRRLKALEPAGEM